MSGTRITSCHCGQLTATCTGIAVPVGTFADPSFSPPRFSVWEQFKHQWLAIPGRNVEHSD